MGGQYWKELARQELKEVGKRYEAVYEVLITATPGSYEHEKAVKEERELTEKDIGLRKRLGIHISNPCSISDQLRASGPCGDCTGYYIRVVEKRRGKKPKSKTIEIDLRKIYKCKLKK